MKKSKIEVRSQQPRRQRYCEGGTTETISSRFRPDIYWDKIGTAHFGIRASLFGLLALLTFSLGAQNRMVMKDNIFMVIDSAANLVIDNSATNAITTIGAGGNIVSENEADVIKWNIAATTGNYVIPWTTTSGVKIPLEINITGAGIGTGYLIFATYETTTDNNQTYPTGVTNMNGSCNGDNSLFAIDRFWRIEASNYTTKPTPIINFGYDDAANEIGGTNTITESKLKAQRYNTLSNSWETPQFLYGIANATSNQVQNSNVTPTDFYTWWTLVDTSVMIVTDTVNVTICSNDSIFLQGAFQNTAGFYTDTIALALVCDTNRVTNLTVLPTTTGIDIQTACGSYIWIDGNTYTTSNNTATYTIVGGNANGCDSVVTLNLTINTIDNTTTANNDTITANQTGATYQWLDCNVGNTAITGATNQTYIATANGSYAVAVTMNGCTDTSSCVNVTGVGINQYALTDVAIYPNPMNSQFTIDLGKITSNTQITIVSIDGKVVYNNASIKRSKVSIDASTWSKGVYFVQLQNNKALKTIKLIKE